MKHNGLFGLIVTLALLCSCSSDRQEFRPVREPLPYALDALEPVISRSTMDVHYNKHYAGYVARTQSLLKDSSIREDRLEDVIRAAKTAKKEKVLLANAAQAWNHAFFWKCLAPGPKSHPTGKIQKMIDQSFGGLPQLKQQIIEAANAVVGSGWVWIVQEGDGLKVVATANADTPVVYGGRPIFTIDIWEHAYYLDYRNNRTGYVSAVLDNLVNWEFAASRLD